MCAVKAALDPSNRFRHGLVIAPEEAPPTGAVAGRRQSLDEQPGTLLLGEGGGLGEQARRRVGVTEALLGERQHPQRLGQPPHLAPSERLGPRLSEHIEGACVTGVQQGVTGERAQCRPQDLRRSTGIETVQSGDRPPATVEVTEHSRRPTFERLHSPHRCGPPTPDGPRSRCRSPPAGRPPGRVASPRSFPP